MNTARSVYRVNHSDLRRLARDPRATPEQRAAELKKVCDDRAFWLGDRWSQPAHPAAQAALRVLRGRPGSDPLQMMVQFRNNIPADQLPAFLRARHGLRTLWTR